LDEYFEYGVPHHWDTVYDSSSKFILTGGFSDDNIPGDILIQTTEEMAGNEEFITIFYHPFTNLETEINQQKRLLSANQSIEMLKYPDGESDLFFSIDEDGRFLSGKKRIRNNNGESEEYIEEDIVKLNVCIYGNYIRNKNKKQRTQ
jgi:hypothetical protein